MFVASTGDIFDILWTAAKLQSQPPQCSTSSKPELWNPLVPISAVGLFSTTADMGPVDSRGDMASNLTFHVFPAALLSWLLVSYKQPVLYLTSKCVKKNDQFPMAGPPCWRSAPAHLGKDTTKPYLYIKWILDSKYLKHSKAITRKKYIGSIWKYATFPSSVSIYTLFLSTIPLLIIPFLGSIRRAMVFPGQLGTPHAIHASSAREPKAGKSRCYDTVFSLSKNQGPKKEPESELNSVPFKFIWKIPHSSWIANPNLYGSNSVISCQVVASRRFWIEDLAITRTSICIVPSLCFLIYPSLSYRLLVLSL